jgi:hypothetical protein
MRDVFPLGPTPIEESCAQVGQPGYRAQALAECARFIALLRATFGPEPEGAARRTEGFDHDFGVYFAVVCAFDTDYPAAVAYAPPRRRGDASDVAHASRRRRGGIRFGMRAVWCRLIQVFLFDSSPESRIITASVVMANYHRTATMLCQIIPNIPKE